MKDKAMEFETVVRHDDPMMRDHVVHDTRILPGVFLLDLIVRTGEHVSGSPGPKVLEQVLFFRPVVTTQDTDRRIVVSYSRSGGAWNVRVTSRCDDQESGGSNPEIHAECVYRDAEVAITESLDVVSMIGQATHVREIDDVYAIARECDIKHLSFMKSLGTIFLGEDYLIAEVGLGDEARQYVEDFSVHPVLMDVATGLPTYFRKEQSSGDRQPFIPFSIDRFTWYSATDDKPCYVYSMNELTQANNDLISYSLGIFAADGQCHVKFDGIKLKKIRSVDLITALAQRAEVPTSTVALPQGGADRPTEVVTSPPATTIDCRSFLKSEIAKVIDVPVEQVDAQRGFYELGLDSTDLLRLVRSIEAVIGRELYPTLLFEYSTVEQLAQFLKSEHGVEEIDFAEAENADHIAEPKADQTADSRLLRLVWTEEDVMPTPASAFGAVVVVGGQDDFLAGLEEYMGQSASCRVQWGVEFTVTGPDRYMVRKAYEHDYRQAFAAGDMSSRLPLGVVVDLSAETERQSACDTVTDVTMLTKTLADLRAGRPTVLLLLVDARRAEQLALRAFGKSAVKEVAGLDIRVLVRQSGSDDASLGHHAGLALCADTSGEKYSEYESARRIASHIEEITTSTRGEDRLRMNGVYLITGGLKGIGYLFARHLADTYHATLILTGRSALDRDMAMRVAELRRTANGVEYFSADVGDRGRMIEIVDQVRAMHGRLNGVIHNAGVKIDGLIACKDPTVIPVVVGAKTNGVAVLDEATKDCDLDFFVMSSSMSSVFGNPGQSDYAYANGYLDAFAQLRAERVASGERSGHSCAINWPLWENGGMGVGEEEESYLRQKFGMLAIDARAGVQSLELALGASEHQVIVFHGQYDRFKQAIQVGVPEHAQERPTGQNREHVSRTRSTEDRDAALAIVGLAGTYAASTNLDEFWDHLLAGHDLVTEIPRQRWNAEQYYDAAKGVPGKSYCKWGSFIQDYDKFDPLFFGISPAEAELMDPHERWFLQTSWQVFEDAGYKLSAMPRDVGVFVGAMWNDYQLYGAGGDNLADFAPASAYLSTIANRVSYCLNLTGPSIAIDTLCSSSLVSIHLACESIRRGECKVAIAGGVNFTVHPVKYQRLSHMQMVSPTGRCHSFGAAADGYVPGEGVGAVLIKPLDAALKDGDHIYGLIRGSTVRHGGKTGGYTVPSPVAQSTLIEDTLSRSATDPHSISYVEAHGTGTSLGDPIEFQGLLKAFGPVKRKGVCALGSLKSNIGHLEAAAGIAGVTKLLLQFKHKTLVPTLHADVVNPSIDFEGSPFFLQKTRADWKSSTPRRAAISSFGAGGVNCHMILEEAPARRTVPDTDLSATETAQLIILSARTREALQRSVRNLYDHIVKYAADPLLSLRNIAYTLQVGREEMQYRYATVVRELDELKEGLAQAMAPGGLDGAGSSRVRSARPNAVEEKAVSTIPMRNVDGLRELSRRWLSGGNIDWSCLWAPASAYRISLPSYAFETERYWVNGIEAQAYSGGASRLHALSEADKLHPPAAAGTEQDKSIPNPPKVAKNNSRQSKSATTPAAHTVVGEPATNSSLTTGVMTLLLEAVGNELKLDPKKIEVDMPLTDYGIDSVKAMTLTTRLEKISGRLPTMLLFECSSVSLLAGYLVEHHGDKWAKYLETQQVRGGGEVDMEPALETEGRESVG